MKIKRYQQGGSMPVEAAPAPAPAPEQGGDPIMQLAEMAGAALQGQDCGLAMQVCEGFMMLVEQMMGGGAAPAQQPVFRKGGKLVRK